MTMPDPRTDDQTQSMQDQLIFMEALYEIAAASNDAEIVRVAVQALTRTQAGLTYLSANPMVM
jgi:hypothetical protein